MIYDILFAIGVAIFVALVDYRRQLIRERREDESGTIY